MKCVFLFSLQLLFKASFSPINTQEVTLEICAEMHVNCVMFIKTIYIKKKKKKKKGKEMTEQSSVKFSSTSDDYCTLHSHEL
jgi:predicted membrane protein